jgi:hypothetical protein
MDNFFQNCPPKMEDQGRHLSDHSSSTRRDERIKYINDIYRDDQYRLFLQTNGSQILDNLWNHHSKYNRCSVNECVHHYPTRMNPRQFVQQREAHDSIFDMRTNKPLEHLRQCKQQDDYRLNPDDAPIEERPMFEGESTYVPDADHIVSDPLPVTEVGSQCGCLAGSPQQPMWNRN